MRDRRANLVGRAATADIPRISLGGLRLAVLDVEQTADFMIEDGVSETPGRPPALSHLGQWRGAGALLDRADDGAAVPRRRSHQCRRPAAGHGVAGCIRARRCPERVATTDLFHVVRAQGASRGADVLYVRRRRGGKCRSRRQRPQTVSGLRIVGSSHGYLRGQALRDKVAEINALAPDYLWVGLGVPYEQAFVEEFGPLLSKSVS